MIAFVIASTASFNGCAHMQPQTSRQLERGQSVLTASLSVPGTSGLIPRGSLQLTHGLGHGDVSANIGTSGLHWGGGLGARLYLSPTYHLETGLMYRYALPVVRVSSHTFLPRIGISSATTEDRRFYWGTALHAYLVTEYFVRNSVIHTVRGGYETNINDGLTGYVELGLPLWSANIGSDEVGANLFGAAVIEPVPELESVGDLQAFYWNGLQLNAGLNWFGI